MAYEDAYFGGYDESRWSTPVTDDWFEVTAPAPAPTPAPQANQNYGQPGAVIPANPNPPSSGAWTWTAPQNHETQTTDPTRETYNPRDKAAENVSGNVYDFLRSEADKRKAEWGWDPFESSDVMGVIRNLSYANNKYTSNDLVQNVLANWEERNRENPGAPEGGGARMGFGGFGAPNSMQPFMEGFNAPTADSLLKDPGFLARLKEGSQAIQRSAAAKGTLLTGGTLKGLDRFGQDYASNEYSKHYGRAMDEYLNRANIHFTNEGNRFNSERANRNDDWRMYTDQFNMDQTGTLNAFNMNRATGNDQFNQTYSLASLMNPSTLASILGNYGNVGSNLITGAGNAGAAGMIGSGNAWGGGLGNLANMSNQAAMAWLLRQPSVAA